MLPFLPLALNRLSGGAMGIVASFFAPSTESPVCNHELLQ